MKTNNDGIFELNAEPNHPLIEKAIERLKEYNIPVLERVEIISLIREATKQKLLSISEAEERAVGFAEWIADELKPIRQGESDVWEVWDLKNIEYELKTTSELFQLYLTSTGQQSENKTEQK